MALADLKGAKEVIFNFDNLNGGAGPGPIRQRKGLGKFLETIFDNLGRLMVTSFFTLLSVLPGAVGLTLSGLMGSPLLMLLSGVVGGALMGPFYGAMSDGILRSLRGLPGSWGERYRRVLKRDWKCCVLPGIAVGCLTAAAVNVFSMRRDGMTLPGMLLPSLVVALLLAVAIFTFFWPQRAALDLSLRHILRNCVFLMVAHPAVTLGAVAVQVLYWGLIVLTVPYSGLFLLITGFWFPALAGNAIVYEALNRDLLLDERLSEREGSGSEDE